MTSSSREDHSSTGFTSARTGPSWLDAVDEQAREAPTCGRGEADAERVVHEAAHLLDLGPQGVVEDLDPARLGAQDGVAVLAHVGERRLAPRPGLGVERRRAGLDLADLVGDVRGLLHLGHGPILGAHGGGSSPRSGTMVPYAEGLLLSAAIVAEVVGTIALRDSHGFSRPLPTLVVVAGYALSFWLLALVLRDLPVGYVYAVWSAVGTALIAVVGILAFGEPSSVVKFASLGLIVAGVVGLNLAGGPHEPDRARRAPAPRAARRDAAARRARRAAGRHAPRRGRGGRRAAGGHDLLLRLPRRPGRLRAAPGGRRRLRRTSRTGSASWASRPRRRRRRTSWPSCSRGRWPATASRCWPSNELYQAAARTPALRSEARRWTDAYLDVLAPMLARLGAADPRGDAELVVATLDGLLDLRVSEERCSPAEPARPACGACSPPSAPRPPETAAARRAPAVAVVQRARGLRARTTTSARHPGRPAGPSGAAARCAAGAGRAAPGRAPRCSPRARTRPRPLVPRQHARPGHRLAAPADRHAEDRSPPAAEPPPGRGHAARARGSPGRRAHGPARAVAPGAGAASVVPGAAGVSGVGGSPGAPGAVAGVVPRAARASPPRRASSSGADHRRTRSTSPRKGRAQVPS